MALRSAPSRELRLDAIYRKRNGPGVRGYVFDRLEKGHDVKEIVEEFAVKHGVTVGSTTLYAWLKRWKQEQAAEQDQTQMSTRRRGRQGQEEKVVEVGA